jgi:uncharacterized protein YraI
MHAFRASIGVAAVVLLSGAAFAEPAYVVSTVNLRSAAGTNNEVMVKIPTGSLVDATNCSEWCEVEWQGKKGFAIATALDRSGRVPPRHAGPAGPGAPAGRGYTMGEYVPVDPPVAYGPPPAYYYGYRPYYYGPWGWRRRYW